MFLSDPKQRLERLMTSMLSIVKTMIDNGLDLNIKDKNGIPLLHHIYGKAHGSMDAVIYAIEHGADPSIQDNDGHTLLHLAALNDDASLIEILPTNINVSNNEGRTPIFYAACYNQFNAAKLLLIKGADTNIKDIYNVTPIEKVIRKDHMYDLLVQYGAKLKN
jgi:ankyrin repeat protein